MISKVKSLKKSKFFKNVLVVMTGTALAQVITFIFMPIVTRLYGPEAIGVLGTFSAVVTILSPVVALTYPIAIVLPKSDRKARSLVKLALLLTLILGLILTFILMFFSNQLVALFRLDVISTFIFLIPIYVLVTGFSQVIEQWLIRTKEFEIKAKTAILQSLFINGSKVGAGYVYPLSATLIIIQTIGIPFKSLLMFLMSNRSIINRSEKHSLKELKEQAIQYRDFPVYRAPQIFINAISQGLPILLLAAFYGPAIAGFYSLGKQALNTPVQLLGNAVQDVFYPKINELSKNNMKITSVILKSVAGLFAIGIIPFGIIILFGPWIFNFIFGIEWYTAGEYARWIALVSLSMLLTRPIIAAIPVLGIQKHFLIVELVGTIGKTVTICLGVYFFEETIYAVALFSIASILMYLYLTIHTIWESRKFDYLNHNSSKEKRW